jgi:hypothetical protein
MYAFAIFDKSLPMAFLATVPAERFSLEGVFAFAGG